ncbi:MAG TPA: hypothetical protein VNK96_05725 [Fimbriimonadales bacterium]|nr:hypothetical protein [Fimbriimonadales bacterium]
MFVHLLIASLLSLSGQNPSWSFRFQNGEILKYRSSVNEKRTMKLPDGTLELTADAEVIVTLRVTSVNANYATMSVGYSQPKAKVSILKAPPKVDSKKKKEYETSATEQLKRLLLAGDRTQRVTSRGVSTYVYKVGAGKSLTIENGGFFLLVLPKSPPKVGQTWSANVALPDPNGSEPVKYTYKYVGMQKVGKEDAYKITLSSSTSGSQKMPKGGTLSGSEKISGYMLLGKNSGKLLSGEISRVATSRLSSESEKGEAKVTTVQRLTKL